MRLPANDFTLNEALAALNRMLLARTITQFATNFDSVRSHGAAPEVRIWIPGQDELSIARMRARVEEALTPVIEGVRVTVYPDPSAGPT